MCSFKFSLTFSQAKRTGAVARPSFKSAAAGLPIVSDEDTKSKRSSTNWKANPRFLPYRNAVSMSGASEPAIVAAYKRKQKAKKEFISEWIMDVDCVREQVIYLHLCTHLQWAMLSFCRFLWNSAKSVHFPSLLHPVAWIPLVLSHSRPVYEGKKMSNWTFL